MHPILFHLGGLQLHTYGLMAALGFLAAVGTWLWVTRKEEHPKGFAADLGLYLMVSGILGARAAYVVANWSYYGDAPLEIIRIDQGGLIFYGGLILASLTLVVFSLLRRMPVFHVADFAIPGLALGHALGRIGCFLNGCCYGRPATDHPALGLVYPPACEPGRLFPETPLYPVQLMEAMALVLIWGVLMAVYPRRRKNGEVFALYLLLYPPVRFVLEYLRGDTRQAWWAVDVAQAVSMALFLCGLALLWLLPSRLYRPLRKPASSPGK